MKKELKLSTIIGYGTGNFGYGFVTQMFSSYFVFYATAILLLPGSLIGIIVSLSIVWDAISDPLMGYISDNTRSKIGKRHIYILSGTLLISITNLFLWHVSIDISLWIKFFWILLSVFMIKTFVTVFITPYAALGAEMSSDYNERSKIQAVKTIFFLSALMIVTAVCMFIFFKPTPAYELGQFNPQAYKNIAYTSSLVMLITGFITYISTLKYKSVKIETGHRLTIYELKDQVSYSLRCKDFRQVFLGYLFTNTASAIIGVIGLHTFTFTFAMNSYKIGIVLGIQFFVCIISQPIWVKIARKIDKKAAVKRGLLISIFGCMMLFGLVVFRQVVIVHYEYMIAYAVVIGFGTSGLFSLPLSMVADTVDRQELETGERTEGIYFGMLNFGYKISQSIAILLLGFILDMIQFNPDMTIHNDFTATSLGIVLSLGSLLSFIMANYAYSSYSLDEKKVEAIQAAIKLNRIVK